MRCTPAVIPVRKLFTKVNRVNFGEVIASMPIGKVIRPKQTTAELISQYTRAMQNSMGSNVETLHQLDGAEALSSVLRRTISPVFPCEVYADSSGCSAVLHQPQRQSVSFRVATMYAA